MTRHKQALDTHDQPGSTRRPEIRDQDIRVDRVDGDVGVLEARRRFGGLDWLATLAGLVATVGTLVLLGGLVGAVGSVGYQLGADGQDPSIAALAAGLVVLGLAFYTGGWVAGRVARYDGGRNGLMTALEFVILAAALAGLGAWLGQRYDIFADLNLPSWFSDNKREGPAVISGIAGALVALLAGWLGGTVGARYHRRADALVTHTRDGGLLHSETGHQAQPRAESRTQAPSKGRLADGALRRDR